MTSVKCPMSDVLSKRKKNNLSDQKGEKILEQNFVLDPFPSVVEFCVSFTGIDSDSNGVHK